VSVNNVYDIQDLLSPIVDLISIAIGRSYLRKMIDRKPLNAKSEIVTSIPRLDMLFFALVISFARSADSRTQSYRGSEPN